MGPLLHIIADIFSDIYIVKLLLELFVKVRYLRKNIANMIYVFVIQLR